MDSQNNTGTFASGTDEKILTDGQQQAYNLAIQGENIFITGDAGTGKSYLITQIIEDMEKAGRTVAVTASTGIAAVQIGGQTAHRFFGIPLDIEECLLGKTRRPAAVKEADTVIIDEISMIRIDAWSYIARVVNKENGIRAKKGKRPLQIIAVGDFYQIPPVAPKNDIKTIQELSGVDIGKGYAFRSKSWTEMNLIPCVLTEPMRQRDPELLANLNLARKGDPACLTYFNRRLNAEKDPEKMYIYLCGTNRSADERNKAELDRLPGKEKLYTGTVEGEVKESDKPAPQELHLKVGARVMTLKNDKDGQYCNGTIGIVTAMGEDCIRIQVPGSRKQITLERETWKVVKYAPQEEQKAGEDSLQTEKKQESRLKKQEIGSYTQFPVRLAWAVTIHKSQGQTYDAVELDPRCWETGQLYVALSRVRTCEGLVLTRKATAGYLRTDPSVNRYYRLFRP